PGGALRRGVFVGDSPRAPRCVAAWRARHVEFPDSSLRETRHGPIGYRPRVEARLKAARRRFPVWHLSPIPVVESLPGGGRQGFSNPAAAGTAPLTDRVWTWVRIRPGA